MKNAVIALGLLSESQANAVTIVTIQNHPLFEATSQ